MGNVCGDKETSLTKNQKKCSKCGVSQGGKVFTAYQGCSHLICQDCTQKDGSKQFVCPLGPDKPNVMIEFGRQLYSSIIRPAYDDQLCPNKHKMVWRDDFEMCSVCKTHLHGYKCRICNQSSCTMCSKVFKPTSKKCPNKHPLSWRLANIFCLICGNKRHGWTCRECRWYACSQCCETKFTALGCPNGHKYHWKNTKSECSLCSVSDKVFECSSCKLAVCALCCGYSYERKCCPNGHATKISQRQVCTKCEAEGTGMSCADCSFHFCTKCDLEKYATIVRSPLETYSTVKVIVQNPLLHFERQNAPGPVQQAATKVPSLQLPQIQMKDPKESHFTKSTTNVLDPIDLIREEISQDPQSVPLYLKLAEAYRQVSNYNKQIDAYAQGFKTQQQKFSPSPQVMYSLLQKGSTRSFEQNNISKSLMFTDLIIGLCQTYPKVKQISSQKQKWMLMRVEQLILVKELDEANLEMRVCDDTAQGYERIRLMMESAINYRTHV